MNTMKRRLVHSKMGIIRAIAYLNGASVTANGGWIYISMPDMEELSVLNRKIDQTINPERQKCTTKCSL